MSNFAPLMRRADTLRRVEPDPVHCAWWAGYMRGLRRSHHGDSFSSDAEHQLWLSASESGGPSRAALGQGYRAGLTLEAHDPPSLHWCQRCGQYTADVSGDPDHRCAVCGLM